MTDADQHTPDPPTGPRQRALATAVTDIERHVAGLGWDAPVMVLALVRTAAALDANPDLAEELPAEAVAAAEQDAEHLTSI
ncbi:hypothetical protein PU560_09065, partial [Georgenia sp. 10Sc9-8]|nr:hypothetical protein [Georgenia halotolerans]